MNNLESIAQNSELHNQIMVGLIIVVGVYGVYEWCFGCDKNYIMLAYCNFLFFLGHYWSRLILKFDCMGWTYPVYNYLMIKSVGVNDKYGFDVWGEVDE